MAKPKIQTTYTLVITHGKEEEKEDNEKMLDYLLKTARLDINFLNTKNAVSWKKIS